MKTSRLYMLSAALTTGLTLAGGMLDATLPAAGERPLASPSATALIGECRLTGAIAEADGFTYAEFEGENPGTTSAEFSFYYTVQLTPGASPMSRMMPVPRQVTNGVCRMVLQPGDRHTERIQLPASGRKPALPVATNGTSRGESPESSLLSSPDYWVLLVSLSNKPVASGWGGVLPSPSSATNRLEEGTLVLAKTALPERVKAPKGE